MVRRRTALSVLAILLGVAIILSVPYRVWQPTVGNPNFWEGHTSGLLPLVFQAVVGGALLVAGVAVGFDLAVDRTRPVDRRVTGAAGAVGGLLGYGPVVRVIAGVGPLPVGYFGLQGVAQAMLVVAVAGLFDRYRARNRRSRYGAGVLAGGFVLLSVTGLLQWGLRFVEPRSGALAYPPLGLTLVGTVALAIGSVVLGTTVLDHDDAPRWLGFLLVVAGLLAVPIGVVDHLQYRVADGLFGLVWVVVGAHLATSRPHSSSS